MKKIIEMLKKIPKWGWVMGVVYFAAQYGIYRLANWLSVVLGTVGWAIEPKIPAFANSRFLIFIMTVWHCQSLWAEIRARFVRA